MSCALIEDLSRLIVWMGHVLDLKASVEEAESLCQEAEDALLQDDAKLDALNERADRLETMAEQVSEGVQ